MTLEDEFAKTVTQHKGNIYTVCYMFSKDQDEINDLFQEVLINLWEGFKDFRGESKISTWIYRVRLNTCLMMDRNNAADQTRSHYLSISTCLRIVTKTPNKLLNSTNASTYCRGLIRPLFCFGLRI